MVYGIPEFRLPKDDVVKAEIENIKKYENTMINSSDELYQNTKTIYETGEKLIEFILMQI